MVDNILAATTIYCRSVCHLVGLNLQALQESGHDVAVETDTNSNKNATELLHNDKYKEWFLSVAAPILWSQQHPGTVPAALSPQSGHKTTTSATGNADVEVLLPCCKECGSGLQPGFNGSTVRLKHVKKKPRLRQPKKSKRSNNTKRQRAWAKQKDPLSVWKTMIMATERQDDGITGCCNKMILICGTCQAKTVFPGLPIRSTAKYEATQTGGDQAKLKASSKVKPTNIVASATAEKGDPQTALEENLDFVPLETSRHSETTAEVEGGQKRKGTEAATLSLKKAKKKKRPKTKSSELYNFLSSLND